MKYIPRHTHSIEIEFSNKGLLLFRDTFPIKNKSTGKISQWYKLTKLAVASSQEIPVWQIKGKHKIIQSTCFDRIIFEWAGGFAIDLPDNATSYDYKIVLHYLEGLKMAI
jgi:hypothetical protein